MKTPLDQLRGASVAAVLFCLSLASAHAARPAISIDEAIALAQKDLRDRGLDREYYVNAVTLERDSVLSRKVFWFARWSAAIPRPDRKKEVGLQIDMNGATIRVLKAPATRSQRASVLDLRAH